MVFLQCGFFSQVLGMGVSVNVLLPEGAAPAGGWPVLWLLHGLGDDHSAWMRRSAIERYAEACDIAVVMPAVGRSFYTDQVAGYRYFTFVAEELPEFCRNTFHISPARADNYVAGLSMGGYGALKLALRHPDRYAAAASMSGALHISSLKHRDDADQLRKEFQWTFGDLDAVNPDDNLLELSTRHAEVGTTLPRLLQMCGTEDYLYPVNIHFRDHMRKLGIPLTYEEGPGAHNWEYWDAGIERILEWMEVRKKG